MEEPKIPKKNNNFPELEDEDEEEEQDFEFAAKFCPYLQARSFFQKFFPKNATLDYLENFHKFHPNISDSKYASLPDFLHLQKKKNNSKNKKAKKNRYEFNRCTASKKSA